ncbi:hypothetical protein ZEAMMB73_Zm00001d050510 [Zea mays]|uniref:inositol-1,3,4-trisphosphate 5/6-kinase n=1 Tax=Zea mays TaxID=4577 RepID=A0A1D6Q1Z2_MAIZE|nr:hypothetical protein ZEAMMB73_Zm00001d050510 [Zea mays]
MAGGGGAATAAGAAVGMPSQATLPVRRWCEGTAMGAITLDLRSRLGVGPFTLGGVMFKVYIIGDAIRVVRRFSLPNVDEGDMSNNAGGLRLFDIDMIREHGTRDWFYVIDMNYFPGAITLCGLLKSSYIRGESRFSDHRPVYNIFMAKVESARHRRSNLSLIMISGVEGTMID